MSSPSASDRLPEPGPGLALIKPAVQAQAAYALEAPTAARKLNQDECPYDFPAELKQEVLARLAAAPWHRYPAFPPSGLHERLAAHYGWRPDGVLVGNGSHELIQAALAVALADGDVVVAPAPTFSLYCLLTSVFGGRYVAVPLGIDYAYDLDALIAAAQRERARVVVLNSPNNPTGSVLPPQAVERVLAETAALVLVDETYQDFGGPTALPCLERSSRVVVFKAFGPALGMAGLRCGVVLAHPAMAREIAKARLPHNVNLPTLIGAEVALDHADLLAERTRRLVETRELTEGRLALVSGLTVFPSAANFFLIRCHALPAKDVFQRLLEEHGILVRDVSRGADLAECLRISVGTPEDMDAVAEALGAIFAGETAKSEA